MKINNILVFNPFGIGDVLFTTPLLRNLKEKFPSACIYYICNKRVCPIIRKNKFLYKIMIFEKDEWRDVLKKSKFNFLKKILSFGKEIKKCKIDIMFDLSMNSQYGFFFKMMGIKKRIGFDFKNRGRFLTHKINITKGYKEKHVAGYCLDLLKFLNISPNDYKFDLFLSESDIEASKDILNQYEDKKNKNLLVGICPGSGDSWQETAYFKRWPKESFIRLIDQLSEKQGVRIVLFGSKGEMALCEHISAKVKRKVLNLCGKFDLEKFCGLVSLCDIIISNDGGPFHIAQALGKKTFVFFGPVDEKVYGAYPNEDISKVFKKHLSCRPCYNAFKFKGCAFDKKCLRNISNDEVFEAIKKECLI